MAVNHLTLRGNIKMGADTGTAVDVSDSVLAITIMAKRSTIEIKPTFGAAPSTRAGSDTYEIAVQYYSDQAASGTITELLWAALIDESDGAGDPAGSLYFEATLGQAAVSATNPKFSGRFIVTGVNVGGEANTVAEDSQTFPLIGRPTRANA